MVQIVEANRGRSGFTHTHYDVLENLENRQLVAWANQEGFAVNLSGNSPAHADQLSDLRIAPVTTLLPMDTADNLKTESGGNIILCPEISGKGMTCATCQICSKQRQAIVVFPAIGAGAGKAEKARL